MANVKEETTEKISSDYDWSDGNVDNTPQPTKKAENKEQVEPPPQDTILILKNKMRDLKLTYEQVFGEGIDIEIMYFRAPKKIHPYIVRSLNMKDTKEIDSEIKEKIQSIIASRKALLANKSNGSKKEAENFEAVAIKSITDEEYENVEWGITISKAVLYPASAGNDFETGKILPGHFRGIMEFIYMLSGYTPPIFDTDNPDDNIEFDAPEGVEVD